MTTEERILKVLGATLEKDPEEIHLEDNITDLAKDSIQLFELVIHLEKEFDQKAKYEDLMDIVTVGDIVRYVESATNTASS